MEDILISDAMNGVAANWMRASLQNVGLDPANMPQKRGPRSGAEMPEGVRPWRDIWSAGHSVGLIDAIQPAGDLVARFASEFAKDGDAWRERLRRRLT